MKVFIYPRKDEDVFESIDDTVSLHDDEKNSQDEKYFDLS